MCKKTQEIRTGWLLQQKELWRITHHILTYIHVESCNKHHASRFTHHASRITRMWSRSFTRKIQHGGDWERSRPQGPKNVRNFLITVRPLFWACGHGTEMLLMIKKTIFDLIIPDIFRYDRQKKCPTILYAVNLWLKPVSVTGANRDRGHDPCDPCDLK